MLRVKTVSLDFQRLFNDPAPSCTAHYSKPGLLLQGDYEAPLARLPATPSD